jgi:hypothetical protein
MHIFLLGIIIHGLVNYIRGCGLLVATFSYLQLFRSNQAAESANESKRSANGAEDSATSAPRANDLAQHAERLAIYKTLQTFQLRIPTQGPGFSDSELCPIDDAAKMSEFYFPRKDCKALAALVDQASQFNRKYALYQNYRESSQQPEARDTIVLVNHDFNELRRMCKVADEALRVRLRLESSEVGENA